MYMHTNPNPRNHEIDDCVVNEVKANLLAAIEEKEKSDGIGGDIQNKPKE